MEENNKLIPSLSIWLLHFLVNKILLGVESLIVESPVKNCSLKDFLTLFTSQNQMNNDILGKIYFSFIPGNGAKDVSARNCSQTTKEQANIISQQELRNFYYNPLMLVPEIVPRLLDEQANTISKVKLNKIGFMVLKTSSARRK